MATITVIIPIYNAERYLNECISSIQRQSFKDYEVILSDDGSTDSSPEICDRIASNDSRFKVIHAKNGGVSAARNRALDITTSQWVTFVDADDTLRNDALSLLISISRDSQADIVRGDHTFTPHTQDSTHDNEPGQPSTKEYSAEEAIAATLYQHNRMVSTPCGALIRTALFDGMRFIEGIRYEDLELIPRLYLKARKIIWVDAPLYYYRQHAESFIHNWNESRADVLTVTDRLERLFDDNPRLRDGARDRKFSANYNIFILASLHRGSKEIADRCWSVIRQYRRGSLTDSNVRLKNRLGAALSYTGRRSVILISRLQSWLSKS